MSPEDITPSEKSQSQKDNIVWFLKIILYDSSCRRSLEESNPQRQKVEWWLPGAGGEGGMENWCLMGIEFQFYKMMTAMLMNGADGCAALWVYLISLNYILKLVKMMNFMLCVFYIFFNWKNFFLVKILSGPKPESCKPSAGSRVSRYHLCETDVQLLSRWGDIPGAFYSTISPKSSHKNFINRDITILPASSPKLANFITCPGQYLIKMIQLWWVNSKH